MKISRSILQLFVLALAGTKVRSRGQSCQRDKFIHGHFPDNFLWGLSSSAYQIEGDFDPDGQGETSWDVWSHENNGSRIIDRSNGDVACDSYHKFLDDVTLLRNIGATSYRFSISWSRILPSGTLRGGVNKAGIDYYNKLINALIANGITPFVTMVHYDLPKPLEDIGGWINEAVASHFEDYSRILYSAFGDRVKFWITFNEPSGTCRFGYASGFFPPGIRDSADKPYKCAHTIIKAHGLAYRAYESKFKRSQKGQVGIVLTSVWAEPRNPNRPSDVQAAERYLQFDLGWFANPLYDGEYPPIMRTIIDNKSKEEGRKRSRLPFFNSEWTRIINGSLDFMGLNHYTSVLVFATSGGPAGLVGDVNAGTEFDPEWEGSAAPWIKVVPWGFRKLLNWITKEYDRRPIYITENGFPETDAGSTVDPRRVNYHNRYINELMKAVNLDGADVRGYSAWSLTDSFEWTSGFTLRYGIHYINFNDPNLKRIPKDSAIFLKKLFRNNGFPKDGFR